jgi:hypothetical protein
MNIRARMRSPYHTTRKQPRSFVFYDDGVVSGLRGNGIVWQGKDTGERWAERGDAKAKLDELHAGVRAVVTPTKGE